MKRTQLVLLSLRIGLAFVFLYAVVGSFLAPENWIGYFPLLLRQLVPQNLLLLGFSLYELLLGLWLLWGKKVWIPAILSTLTMLGIIATNLGAFDIIFRDVAIAAMGVALFLATF